MHLFGLGPRRGDGPQEGAGGGGDCWRHGFARRHAPRHRDQEQVAGQHRRQGGVPSRDGHQRGGGGWRR